LERSKVRRSVACRLQSLSAATRRNVVNAPSKKALGFSLSELLVVLAIIGIAVAIGIPLVAEQVRQAKIRSAADQFAVDLRAARMIAVSSHTATSIVVQANPTNAYQYTNAQGQLRRYEMPEGLRIVSSTSPITFQLNGSVTAAATTVLETSLSEGVVERWTITTSLLGVPKVVRERIQS